MQNRYTLVNREDERELIPMCVDMGVGLLPYSPLARGLLAGKGPFQERAQLNALAHAFLWDYAELVRRWATWAQPQDTPGPLPVQDDNVYRRALRGGPVLPQGPDTRDPQSR